MMRRYLLLSVVLACFGCEMRQTMAPVQVPKWTQVHAIRHRVRTGETVIGIAWAHQIDQHDLIRWNHLKAPYRLNVGQWLRLAPPKTHARPPAVSTPHPQRTLKHKRPTQWCLPLLGVKKPARSPYKGLWIVHRAGGAVRASAAGKVVYAGRGMPGYGRIILIQHGGNPCPAYGFNQKILVHAGQAVRAHQRIALSGHDLDGRQGLYFELRHAGRPLPYMRLTHQLTRCH